jgi:hypothetical protein
MNNITDKIAYLKGLAEGMNLDKDKNSHKLLLEVISAMDEMAQAVSQLNEQQEELNEYVESIDDDLADLEDVLFGDEDCDGDCDGCDGCEDDDEDDFDKDEDEDEDETITYNCPHCGKELNFLVSEIEFDEDTPCPACGKPVFPEVEEGSEVDDNEV